MANSWSPAGAPVSPRHLGTHTHLRGCRNTTIYLNTHTHIYSIIEYKHDHGQRCGPTNWCAARKHWPCLTLHTLVHSSWAGSETNNVWALTKHCIDSPPQQEYAITHTHTHDLLLRMQGHGSFINMAVTSCCWQYLQDRQCPESTHITFPWGYLLLPKGA